jgi:hypothetical protein
MLCKGVDWNHVAQNSDDGWALMNTVGKEWTGTTWHRIGMIGGLLWTMWEREDWNHVAQNSDDGWALMNTVGKSGLEPRGTE